MPSPVIIPRARLDLRAINAYIGERAGRAVAENFIDRMESAIQKLSILPRAHAVQPKFGANVRRMVVKSYLVFYQVKDETVYILRVLHGARNITRAMIK
jgi:toxin ParE1/3/4